MDYFGLEEDVAALEAALARSDCAERHRVAASLAWLLRQRDTQRALALADEAESLAAQSTARFEDMPRASVASRVALVRAEAHQLHGNIEAAMAGALAARQGFASVQDAVGVGDSHLLESSIANERGQPAARKEALGLALECYAQAHDAIRQCIAHGWAAQDAVRADHLGAESNWGAQQTEALEHSHPGVAAIANEFFGAICFAISDYPRAIKHYQQCSELALRAGNQRLACLALSNVGAAYRVLGDAAHAFEITERALVIARRTGWPNLLGGCLFQAGVALADRNPSRDQSLAGKKLLEEAHAVLAPFNRSRVYTCTCNMLGMVEHDLGHHERAVALQNEVLDCARQLKQPLLVMNGLRCRAHALSALGRVDEALADAQEVLRAAQEHQDIHRHFEALHTLAQIAGRHCLPAPQGSEASSGVIHYMQEGLRIAPSIPDFIVPSVFYGELAAAFEAIGDYKSALEFERRSIASRELTQSKEALNLSIAMKVRYDTERAQAEAQHQRALAEQEAARTQVLEMMNATLEQLAHQDGLTGLANRRHFDGVLAREIERTKRYGRPMTLLLCDVDHFKRYNDYYGHQAGDHCLQTLAAALRDAGRAADTPARYGGEEFAMILPETGADDASVVGERLRAAVLALALPHAASATAEYVTLSVGLATFTGEEAATPGDLIARADQALYCAKRDGRNRCVAYYEHQYPAAVSV
jgi:diguanylate cyclase (GGDEF)-like protein